MVLLALFLLPGSAKADPGCPILFYPGAAIAKAARMCSSQGGVLIRLGNEWECRDKWRYVTLFAFELAPDKWPKVVATVAYFPQTSVNRTPLTLNAILDALTQCLGFEPETLVMEPFRGSSGLVFRWGLKNGLSVTVTELNRLQNALLLEVKPTPQFNQQRYVDSDVPVRRVPPNSDAGTPVPMPALVDSSRPTPPAGPVTMDDFR